MQNQEQNQNQKKIIQQQRNLSISNTTLAPITLTLPNRGRAKNLLRNYYGLGPDGKKADPLDIGE